MKNYKNSTHDLDKTFRRVALTSTFARKLRIQLEGEFGEDMPSQHTTAKTESEMFIHARNLVGDDLSIPQTQNSSSGDLFTSLDILFEGAMALPDKIATFNTSISSRKLAPIDESTDDIADEAVNTDEAILRGEAFALEDPAIDIDVASFNDGMYYLPLRLSKYLPTYIPTYLGTNTAET